MNGWRRSCRVSLRAMRLETALRTPPPSFARVEEPIRPPLRVAAVQHRWHPDPDEHQAALADGIRLAAEQGAKLVCLQELTLSPYFAITPDGPREPEEIPDGPTTRFAAVMATANRVHVHASLYERADGEDGLGFNTAIVVSPQGELLARTRKLHIPITAGYYEDKYFRPGPGDSEAFPLVSLDPELHQIVSPEEGESDAVREGV